MSAVEERVRDGGLLEPGTPVVVLLSGGRDSVCLLDLAVRLRRAGHRAARRLRPARLRGRRRGALRARCASGSACRCVEVRRRRPPAGNLQAWAREERYAEAERLALARGAIVATGHTATDQVETVLYRLAASPGRRALLGMRSATGRLVRPLLTMHARRDRRATAPSAGCRGARTRRTTRRRSRATASATSCCRCCASSTRRPRRNILRTLELLRDEAAVLDAVVAAAVEPPDVARLAALPPALAAARRAARSPTAPRAAARRRSPRVPTRSSRSAPRRHGALDLGGGLRAVVEYGRCASTADPPPHRCAPCSPSRAAWRSAAVQPDVRARPTTARSTPTRSLPRSRSARGAPATACARSASAAAERCRTCSPTARSRASAAPPVPVVRVRRRDRLGPGRGHGRALSRHGGHSRRVRLTWTDVRRRRHCAVPATDARREQSARSSSRPTTSSTGSASWRRRSRATTRARTCC